MPKYRRKPVIVEAFQIAEDHWANPPSWPEWFFLATQKPQDEIGAAWMGEMDANGLATIKMRFENGIDTARVGEYVVLDAHDQVRITSCPKNIFEHLYEPVYRTKMIDGRLQSVHE